MSLSIERTYVPFRNFFFICYILQGKIYSDKIFTFPLQCAKISAKLPPGNEVRKHSVHIVRS